MQQRAGKRCPVGDRDNNVHNNNGKNGERKCIEMRWKGSLQGSKKRAKSKML